MRPASIDVYGDGDVTLTIGVSLSTLAITSSMIAELVPIVDGTTANDSGT